MFGSGIFKHASAIPHTNVSLCLNMSQHAAATPTAATHFTQPGDVFHILHVIAPAKRTAMAPDFSPDVIAEDTQARCEVVSLNRLAVHTQRRHRRRCLFMMPAGMLAMLFKQATGALCSGAQ